MAPDNRENDLATNFAKTTKRITKSTKHTKSTRKSKAMLILKNQGST